jgi:DNA-binding GntR family transcriptional regulator
MSQLAADISLADKAYTTIRDMIVGLELRPGSLLSERALIERVGVGRTPTREALQRLAQERFVEVYPRRGMVVTPVEIRDLAEICEVRIELESQAARLAAGRLTAPDRPGLEALIDEVWEWSSRDPNELMAFDQRVHRQIYEYARNSYLTRTLEEYYVLSLRIWHVAVEHTPELLDVVMGHRGILEAIHVKNGSNAERLMRAHVRDFELAMRSVLAGHA